MRKLSSVCFVFLVSLSSVSFAQENSANLDAIRTRVAEAYGSEVVIEMKNYEISERYIAPNVGQSWDPAITDIGERSFRVIHDLEASRIYQETWFINQNGSFPNINIVDGDQGWSIDLPGQQYGVLENRDTYALTGGTIRTTDTLLAREFLLSKDSAEYLGQTRWQDADHDLVKIPLPLSSDLTLYIDATTGLITRMSRENPVIGTLDYVFSNHQQVDGTQSAMSVSFSIAGSLNLVGFDRQTRFNQDLNSSAFVLPADLSEQGQRADDRQMVVNKLSDEIYHIGQNGAYSLFIDAGDQVIAVGAYQGLSERLSAFRDVTNNHQPMTYQVVTHHHQDHIGGIDEALDSGAKLVTVMQNAAVLKDASQRGLTDALLLLVNQRLDLGRGNSAVQLHDVSTAHAASNLVVYVPATRTLFLADHFGGGFTEGAPTATANTVSMAAALAPLELNVKNIVNAHDPRVYTKREFDASLTSYTYFECPADRPLCEAR